jgi:hypothetical protein
MHSTSHPSLLPALHVNTSLQPEHVTPHESGPVTVFSLNSPTDNRPKPRRSFLTPTNPTHSPPKNHDVEMMNPSDDSDTAASHMMNALTVHSRKASTSGSLGRRVAHASGGHTTATSSNNTSEADSPTLHGSRAGTGSGSSRKRPRGDLILQDVNAMTDMLVKRLDESTSMKADTKRLRLESKLASRELKAREAHAEREHALRAAMTAHDHEHAMADERTRQLELEIKLEQAKMEHIALERGLGLPQKD